MDSKLHPDSILYGNKNNVIDLGAAKPSTRATEKANKIIKRFDDEQDFTYLISTLDDYRENLDSPLLRMIAEQSFSFLIDDYLSNCDLDVSAYEHEYGFLIKEGLKQLMQKSQDEPVDNFFEDFKNRQLLQLLYKNDNQLMYERLSNLANVNQLDAYFPIERELLLQGHQKLCEDYKNKVLILIRQQLYDTYDRLFIESKFQGKVIIRRLNHRGGKSILHLHGKQGWTSCGQQLPMTYRIVPRGTWKNSLYEANDFNPCAKCLAEGEAPTEQEEDADNYPLLALNEKEWDELANQVLEHTNSNSAILQNHNQANQLLFFNSIKPLVVAAVSTDLHRRGAQALTRCSKPLARKISNDADFSFSKSENDQLATAIVEFKDNKLRRLIASFLKRGSR